MNFAFPNWLWIYFISANGEVGYIFLFYLLNRLNLSYGRSSETFWRRFSVGGPACKNYLNGLVGWNSKSELNGFWELYFTRSGERSEVICYGIIEKSLFWNETLLGYLKQVPVIAFLRSDASDYCCWLIFTLRGEELEGLIEVTLYKIGELLALLNYFIGERSGECLSSLSLLNLSSLCNRIALMLQSKS